ncbi:BT4734/BF3469 family protein [Spirosoma utsteinense]|uniref:Virulence-protein E N-terminal domain-containing protein n=1 Tax=Spirosoma utsteinense TaxID=2585773 RepID=A0ABR6WB51_9BACT|nr:BT4734/BF3469 family protein [Spirosoma utsteinense]MBC3786484.1 hypothetical protein [Spirosoma utsteinense]MBC3793803.1 hypothetical protein [Spirosoma utsteinense]
MNSQPYRPNLLDVPISFFELDHQRGHFANVPARNTSLRRIVSTKYYRSTIEAIRAESDPEKQGELKKQLPTITPVALLHHRRRDTSFAEKISQQWPMMMGDVDIKDNPGVNMAELKKYIARLPYVLLCTFSVRKGLWFVVQLPDHRTPETLAAHFRYLQKLFSDIFGVNLDKGKGGNPTDLRFVSYDPTPYINENAIVLSGTYEPPKASHTIDYSRFNRQDERNLLPRLVRFVRTAGEGQRHTTLLKAATVAGGYIAAGLVDEQIVTLALETIASEWPTFSKSQKTIRDGIRYGLTKPIYLVEKEQPYYTDSKPVVVYTIADQLARPGSILRPEESRLERLEVEQSNHYPAAWNKP